MRNSDIGGRSEKAGALASSRTSTDYFRLNSPVLKAESLGLAWPMQLFWFCVAAAAVISRRPDAILRPQFFAEDGMFWYADAYNSGWLHALLVPHTGYFQTLPRLAAALSLLVPLVSAPLLLNIIAIVIQVLPVTLLLSPRLAGWAPFNLRACMAIAYIALPNSRELDAAVTEAQWHMALLAVLVVLAIPSVKKLWRGFDVAVILLCGLTGPFCVALLPIALTAWWKRRLKWQMLLAGLLALCAALQLYALTTTAAATRSHSLLGATPQLFWRMLVGDVYLGAILGQNQYALGGNRWKLLVVGLLATAVIVYCLWKSAYEFKLFLLYCFGLYFASLRNPMISYDQPQWVVLAGAPGLRYWFFPMLALVWAAIWCLSPGNWRPFRVLAASALILMFIGIKRDWKYPGFDDHDFPEYVRRFEALPTGHAMTFPLYPDGWTMVLNKTGGKGCPNIPTGFVDDPRDHSSTGSVLHLRGWVYSSAPLENVTVFLDGTPVQSFYPSLSRPDVDAKFPGGVLSEKGWQSTLDLSKATVGPHVIEVHAQLKDGCEAVIGASNIMEIR